MKAKSVREVKESKGPSEGHAKKTKEVLKKEIDSLLKDLKNADDTDEKKKIRRQLRARGHWGGLTGVKEEPKKPKAKAKVAAKTERVEPKANAPADVAKAM